MNDDHLKAEARRFIAEARRSPSGSDALRDWHRRQLLEQGSRWTEALEQVATEDGIPVRTFVVPAGG